MAVVNNNKRMIDRPSWEQLTNLPVATAAGSCMVDDGGRFIYLLFSATSFWAYDSWSDTFQQLASPPGGTVAAGTCMRYIKEMGSQVGGVVYGSVYALIASGTAVVFYRYDIGSNTWTAALSVVNIPAAFGTEGRMICPEPMLNAYEGGYHNAFALNTIQATGTAIIGATSITVAALPLALPIGAVLNFGSFSAPSFAVLTSAASAGATSVAVSPLVTSVGTGTTAYWYADIFLFGHAATTMYRYNIATNAWILNSANSGNPALAPVTAAVGAGLAAAWLPGSGDVNALNTIILIRGAASSTIYEYNMVTNVWSTLTYAPATETFSTGSCTGIITNAAGKSKNVVIQKDITMRFFDFDRVTLRAVPRVTQNLIAPGAALAGDKCAVLKSPDGIDFLFFALHTSAYFLRTALVY